MTGDPLVELAAALRSEGGLLADATVDPAQDADRRVAQAVAAGPRSAVVGPVLTLAAEATREAELLHHAPECARVLKTDDRDLALLAGDRLYALGLRRLAEGGWTEEVAILADVVAVVARLHAAPAWSSDAPDAVGGPSVDEFAATRTAALWRAAEAALGQGTASPAAAQLRAVRHGEVGNFAPAVPGQS